MIRKIFKSARQRLAIVYLFMLMDHIRGGPKKVVTIGILAIALLTGCGLKPWAKLAPGRYQVAKVEQQGPTAKVWLAGVRKPIYLPTDTLAPGKYITLATASNKR